MVDSTRINSNTAGSTTSNINGRVSNSNTDGASNTSATAAASTTFVAAVLRWIRGLTDIDQSTASAILLALLTILLLTFAFYRTSRRASLRRPSIAEVTSPEYRQSVAQIERRMIAFKEKGNRAYLQRDYEGAAECFEQATKEAVKLCDMQYIPTSDSGASVWPFGLESGEIPSESIDEPTGVRTHYPAPGTLRTIANPLLATIPVTMLNTLAVYASNRSACLLALNRPAEALVEGEHTHHAQPQWSKGFLRIGQAYEALGLLSRATAMYTLGTRADASDENVAKCLRNVMALQTEVEETMKQQTPVPSPTSASSSSSPSHIRRFASLLSWLNSHGAHFPYLYIQHYESDHRGVHTMCRFGSNKILLSIPFQCIMTSDLARASKVGKAIEASKIDLSSQHSYLACYLLEERRKLQLGKGSFWQPYLETLPTDFRNVPINFTEEEMDMLRGSFTIEKIEERRRELHEEYDRICEKLEGVQLDEDSVDASSGSIENTVDTDQLMEEEDDQSSSSTSSSASSSLVNRRSASSKQSALSSSSSSSVHPSSSPSPPAASPSSTAASSFRSRHTLADFIWARTVVITRVFGFTLASAPGVHPSAPTSRGGSPYKTDGLVPMADMLNHARERESSWNFDIPRNAFVIMSLVNFAARQQVCDSYGRKCNSRFFVNYGFCLENNRDDNQAVIWIPIEQSGRNVAEQSLCDKKKYLLGLKPTWEESLASPPVQSTSSLSSSGYSLSMSVEAIAYPPPHSLRFQLPLTYVDKVAQEVMSIMRLVVASAYDMTTLDMLLTRHDYDAIRHILPINIHNELSVLRTMSHACSVALAQYDTSKEEDEELLALDAQAQANPNNSAQQQHRLTSNQRNCILQRRGEKEIHEYYIQLHEEVNSIYEAYRAEVVLPEATAAAASASSESSSNPSSSASASSSSIPPVTYSTISLASENWDNYLQRHIVPRYVQGTDDYISNVILPMLQAEERRRKMAAVTAKLFDPAAAQPAIVLS